MTEHNREINERAGMSDNVSAVVRPATVRAVAGVASAGAVAYGATARTSSAAVTTMTGLPVTNTFVIRQGTDGTLHEIELTENGKTISFVGDTLMQGMAKLMIHLMRPKPDFPNN